MMAWVSTNGAQNNFIYNLEKSILSDISLYEKHDKHVILTNTRCDWKSYCKG